MATHHMLHGPTGFLPGPLSAYAETPPSDRKTGFPETSQVEFFLYNPPTVVIVLGRQIELWPPAEMIFKGLRFETVPTLPHGLMIEEEMGIIHGALEEVPE